MMHSVIWSNSRSPWRNPNPNARLNPKVEAHREQNRIKQWNKIVQKHIANKQPEKALEFLKETLRLDSKNHYSLGMTAYLLLTYRKDFEAAKEMAQNGLNRNPRSIYCLHALAWLHYKQKEYGLAQRVIQEIQQANYAWFDLQFHWAMINWKAHNRKAAKRHFSLARKLNPTHAPLWISIAMFLEEEKNTNAAVKSYQKALDLIENESPVRNYLLSKLDSLLPLYEAREKLNGEFVAINHKNKLTPTPLLQPKSKKENIRTGHVQAEQKTIGFSSNKWEALENDQNPFLVPIEEDVTKFQKKTQELEQLSLQQHYVIGQELLKAGIREEAISQFQTVINLWSNSEYTISANTALREAKNLGYQTYDSRIQKLFHYGNSLFDQKRFKECLHIQRKILLIQPENARALKNAAFLYLQFQRPITALKLLDKAIEDDQEFLEAKVLKAFSLASLRRFTSAAELLSEVMQNSNAGFHKDYAQELQNSINQYQKPFEKK
tara:strand:- start:812 stop:2290 length:1479 start_codon:yes stop_codon:yes gene_type:complete